MLLKASEATRWMFCAGSAQDYPTTRFSAPTDESREGTCAAWVAERCVRENIDPRDMIGETHENGWIVDADMARHLHGYVEIARSRMDPTPETQLTANFAGVDIVGRADLWSWSEEGGLHIDDLKFGFELIEPQNWQLGVEMMLATDHFATPETAINRVTLGVYQPRALHPEGPYRTITLNITEIAEWKMAIRQQIARIASGADTMFQAGRHCPHCPKAAACVALTRSVYNYYVALSSVRLAEPTPQQLVDEYDLLERAAPIFKARKTAIEAEIEGRLDRGEFIPGMAREPRPGKRKFKDTLTAASIKMITGVDPLDEPKLCTPAELERRGASVDLVKSLTYTPNTGRRLTRLTSADLDRKFKKGSTNG